MLARQLTGRSIPIGQSPKLPVHFDDPDFVDAAASDVDIPSGAATIWRMTPPPDGIGQVLKWRGAFVDGVL